MSSGTRDAASSIRADGSGVRRYADTGRDDGGNRRPVFSFVNDDGGEFGPYPSRLVALAAATVATENPEELPANEPRNGPHSLERGAEIGGGTERNTKTLAAASRLTTPGNCDEDGRGDGSDGDGDSGGGGGGGSSNTYSVDSPSTRVDDPDERSDSDEDGGVKAGDGDGGGDGSDGDLDGDVIDNSGDGVGSSTDESELDVSRMPVACLFPSSLLLVEDVIQPEAVSDSEAELDVQAGLCEEADMFFQTMERGLVVAELPAVFVEGGGLVGDTDFSPENPFGLTQGIPTPPGLLRGRVNPDPDGNLGEGSDNPFSLSEEHIAIASRSFSTTPACTVAVDTTNEMTTTFDCSSF